MALMSSLTSPYNQTDFLMSQPIPPQPTFQRADYSEVAWMFVQEYYSYLHKEPSRLHCFYSRQSVRTHGHEGDPVVTHFGQADINAAFAAMQLNECRVMISNVDAQPSLGGCIVIQVLGEVSNAGRKSQQFVQTFVLAEQPTGYFVLNDVFRYLKEYKGSETNDSEQIDQTTPVEQIVESQKSEEINGITAKIDHSEEIKEPKEAKEEVKEAKEEPKPKEEHKEEVKEEVKEEEEKKEEPKGTRWADMAAKKATKTTQITQQIPVPIQPTQTAQNTQQGIQQNSQEKDELNTVCVKNLQPKHTQEILRKHLVATVGHIKSVYVNNKGLAFVEFDSIDVARQEIERGTWTVLGDELVVEAKRKFRKQPFHQQRYHYGGRGRGRGKRTT